MSNQSRISKMFGALVLGGGILVTATSTQADPTEDSGRKSEVEKKKETTESGESKESSNRLKPPHDRPSQIDPPKDHCQLEFTLYTYDREGVEPVKTCLEPQEQV